jgi:putative membrane protein
MGVIIKILVNAAALWVAVLLLDGLTLTEELTETGWIHLLVIGLILGVANAIVRPILTVLSLPLVILTLGLFLLVVNAAVLALVIWISGAVGLGIESDGFGWTFLGALVVSLVSWGLETIMGKR